MPRRGPDKAHEQRTPNRTDRAAGRRRSISARITTLLALPLGLVVALWMWSMYLTTASTLEINLLAKTEAAVHMETMDVFDALQEERRATAVYLGGSRSAFDSDVLSDRRQQTDKAAANFAELVTDDVLDDVNPAERQWLEDTQQQLNGLPDLRKKIDAGALNESAAEAPYTAALRGCLGIFAQMTTDMNPAYGTYHQTLVDLQRARELLSQEDSLLAGALASGELAPRERDTFVRRVGGARSMFQDAEANIVDPAIGGQFKRIMASDAFQRLHDLEDSVTKQDRSQRQIPITAAEWDDARSKAMGSLRHLEHRVYNDLVAHATPEAIWIIGQLGGMILAGLVVLVIAVYLWRRTVRPLSRQLHDLRDTARALAEERLPRVVRLLQRGDAVNVAVEAPELEYGNDELGDVGHAFNAVQRTAVQAAVDQANLRKGTSEVFVNLARRSQTLVHGQIALLDEMERATEQPDELQRLFKVDHLATRMRRHAESLIILSGAKPGRQWRKAQPMIDVIRSAYGEVDGHDRVQLQSVDDALLNGHGVAEVIHLLAELFENATGFSPPETHVQVRGQVVPNGYVVEIEDRGLGIAEIEMSHFNRQLADPPDLNPSDTKQLGFSVVAQLAKRHDIRVHLRSSPYGGVTAIVLVPKSALTTSETAEPAAPTSPSSAPRVGLPPHQAAATSSRGPVAGGLSVVTPVRNGFGPSPVAEAKAGGDDMAPVEEERRPLPSSNPEATSPGAGVRAAEPILPRRVRQASLNDELRMTTPPASYSGSDTQTAQTSMRPPEETRNMMGAFQRGTELGREEAERTDSPTSGSSLFEAARSPRPSPRPTSFHGEDS